MGPPLMVTVMVLPAAAFRPLSRRLRHDLSCGQVIGHGFRFRRDDELGRHHIFLPSGRLHRHAGQIRHAVARLGTAMQHAAEYGDPQEDADPDQKDNDRANGQKDGRRLPSRRPSSSS